KSAGAASSGCAACRIRSIGSAFVTTFGCSTTCLKTWPKSWRLCRNRKLTHGLKNMEKTMRQVALSEVKDDLSRYLRLAENEEIVITKHGKPAGILVGFASEDDWFDYKLEHDPRFLQR